MAVAHRERPPSQQPHANNARQAIVRASRSEGRFDDLCDTVSAALIHLRDRGLLSLGEEFRREERRHLVYRSRAGSASIRELYEDL